MVNSRRLISIFRWTAAAAMLAGIVVVYHLWLHANPTTVALSLLMLVLFLAANWGLRYAVATSIIATVSYNYYFLPPINTFVINDPQNWLALFAFLAVSVVGSRLAERARREAQDARARQRELEMLYGLSRELLQTENVASVLNAIAPATMLVTGAAAVVLYLLKDDLRYLAGDSGAITLDDIAMRQLALTLPGPGTVTDTVTVTYFGATEARIPLRVGVKPRGLLVIKGIALAPETLDAIAGLVSVSIDRASALEEVTRGEAAKESELRTPLTSIKASATTLLLPDALSKEEQHELLTVIDEESDRLNRLVSEAVEMVQLDAQQVHMTFAPQAVSALVHHALENCSAAVEGREVTVRVPDLEAWADAEMIDKVLCNLIENAGKYSPRATPIFISAERKGEMIAISVADHGMGIDPSEQTLIFERFYRANTQTHQTSGTGMGLAISRAIVEAHHGTMGVTSQLGEGSVFTFTLQVARVK
jgi:two-component system sensor histidine kinase KdpD